MRCIFALLALGIASLLQAGVPSGSIEDFIAAELPISGAPGLAYALVEDGKVHSEARGEVLLFVDADVVLLSGMVERVRSFFSRNLGEAVFGCYDDAPAAPGLVSQYRNLQHHFVHLTNAGAASTFWAGCGAVLQKVFKDVGGFSEDFRHPSVEDIELGMRLTSAGHRIVLDANLRGKHLKSWSLPGMWVNDFQCRAVPWSRLILAGGAMPAGLNTGWASRLAVVAQGLSLVGITLIPLHAAFLGVALALELLALLAHGPLLCFLARKRGLGFALRCVPLVMAYIVVSGAGFAWAWGAWAGQRRRKTFLAAGMPMGDIA